MGGRKNKQTFIKSIILDINCVCKCIHFNVKVHVNKNQQTLTFRWLPGQILNEEIGVFRISAIAHGIRLLKSWSRGILFGRADKILSRWGRRLCHDDLFAEEIHKLSR